MKIHNTLIKSLLAIAIIAIGTWGFSWYTGHTSPAELDTYTVTPGEEVAYFAGGCFWCVESDFEKLTGVDEAVSGYMGGILDSPSYNQVSSGESGHIEIVKVVYNPNQVSYRRLILDLLKHSDPTDEGGSFFDRGHQYTSAIFYSSDDEKRIAEEVIQELEDAKVYSKPIVTSIKPAGTFWVAEDYHQDYYKKNPVRYNHYRKGSGRDAFIESVWGGGEFDALFIDEIVVAQPWKNFNKPSDSELRKTLTALQYKITQKEGTETPFENEYWDNHEDGIYVDIVSGEPLFSSTDKYDSGTGWPSFLKPIDYSFVTEKQDYKLIIPRTEIRSKIADSHLGHIILDGPESNDKIRYCMNSASMRFVPLAEIEVAGYGEFLHLFN
ncbi:peptide-methionine (R)-S-oxide reductase MsrB [Candidatus Uhrbacteria bacterium]|nr:peptide-methionine (R)-S-oxide reductase MsrB [Candidatus Uhrbacteria bacterium]